VCSASLLITVANRPESRDEFAIYRREFLIPSHFIHYVGFCCPLRNGQLVAFDFQRSGRSPGFSSLERARARIIAQYFRLQRAGYEALPGLAPRERCEGALTAREYQVAQAVALGQSNKEVAASLSISVRTVENHMRSIFAKLGVRRRTHLAAKLHDWHG
jgi:DNA-binding CsgD family transcriptional regulator